MRRAGLHPLHLQKSSLRRQHHRPKPNEQRLHRQAALVNHSAIAGTTGTGKLNTHLQGIRSVIAGTMLAEDTTARTGTATLRRQRA
jgi:hypothetical protein